MRAEGFQQHAQQRWTIVLLACCVLLWVWGMLGFLAGWPTGPVGWAMLAQSCCDTERMLTTAPPFVQAEQQLGLSAASLLQMAQALRGHASKAQPPPALQPPPTAPPDAAGGAALDLAVLQDGLAALRMLGLPVVPAHVGGAAGGGIEPPKER